MLADSRHGKTIAQSLAFRKKLHVVWKRSSFDDLGASALGDGSRTLAPPLILTFGPPARDGRSALRANGHKRRSRPCHDDGAKSGSRACCSPCRTKVWSPGYGAAQRLLRSPDRPTDLSRRARRHSSSPRSDPWQPLPLLSPGSVGGPAQGGERAAQHGAGVRSRRPARKVSPCPARFRPRHSVPDKKNRKPCAISCQKAEVAVL